MKTTIEMTDEVFQQAKAAASLGDSMHNGPLAPSDERVSWIPQAAQGNQNLNQDLHQEFEQVEKGSW